MSTMTTTPTFRSREEILHSGMNAHDCALALEVWDREHPEDKTEAEKILDRGLPAFEAAKLIEALPDEPPAMARLLPGERSALAEARNKLELLAQQYAALILKREQASQALEDTAREKRKLETSLDFDDAPGIKSLIFVTTRLDVIRNWLNTAGDKIRGAETGINSIISNVDKLLTRKFGMSVEAGGRLWSNAGFSALPTRIAGCCAAITESLNRK
jgi:hypothetical protein